MKHPKMQYTYVGIDSHKDTHTAVFLDCFFEKLGELQFSNRPSAFDGFLQQAQAYLMPGTTFMFGLEDVAAYGRMLVIFLKDKGQEAKHVNALLVARERKNRNIVQKTDAVDAECAARVLLSKFSELPDADFQVMYWVLRSLVTRRDALVKQRTMSKNHLHTFITQHYPDYRKFFVNIDGKTALSFFMQYPSPALLHGVTAAELVQFLQDTGNGYYTQHMAQAILDSLQNTEVQFQDVRDTVVQSTIRQLRYTIDEIKSVEASIEAFLPKFNCTLTTMSGIDTVTAAKMLSCIGDIRKFPTPAKLARYAGIAPVPYSSGKKDLQFSNQRGNRELNSLFFNLAVRVCFATGKTHKVTNSFFYDYYNRKLAEGKTKRQALKCAERRLVNIVWTMLTNGEDYVNPPTYDLIIDQS